VAKQTGFLGLKTMVPRIFGACRMANQGRDHGKHVAPLDSNSRNSGERKGGAECQSILLVHLVLPTNGGSNSRAGAFCFTGHTLYNVDKRVQEIVKAAGIMRIPVEKLIADWSLAQDRTIRDQLMEGVRYLDVRAIWDGRPMAICSVPVMARACVAIGANMLPMIL
jgi:hypothetical protein